MKTLLTKKTRLSSRMHASVLLLPILALTLSVAGCDDDERIVEVPIDIAPAIPNGVYSITGDQTVFLRWNPNREDDLAGYRIYWNDDLTETFEFLVEVGAFEEGVYIDAGVVGDPSDDFLEYVDDDQIQNGTYLSYAVTAFDENGNESDLSLEVVIDVPRPEGQSGMFYLDFDPTASGFDFSDGDGGPVAFDAAGVDFTLERAGGVPYIVVPNDRVRVQDYGFVGFDVLDVAPLDGYSATGRVEAIEGHTYAFRIASAPGDFDPDQDNFAKLEIQVLDNTGMDFFWGYQPIDGETELRPAGPTRDDERIPNDGGGAR